MNCRQHQHMKKTIGKWNERGSVAVEFALILPMLLALVFGMIDFGRLLYTYETINNAAREGARVGIKMRAVPVTDAEITTQINTLIDGSQLADSSHATVAINRVAVGTSTNLQVGVQYNFGFLVANALIPGLPQTRVMNATSIMRMEGT